MQTDQGEGSIELKEPSGKYKIEISSNKEAKWRVQFKGHPKPLLTWYDNVGKPIMTEHDEKYEVNTSNEHTILKIKQLELKDSGIYTLRAINDMTSESKEFELVVRGKLK